MVDDNFSCIKEVTKIVQVTLPTACTSNEISGIYDVLESWKRQYIQQLQAVVVNYKDISLTSSRGFIKLDYPFVLYNVKGTFELFFPTIGSIVKGKINRISHDYIGCLVHNTINVTIDRSNYFSNFSHFIVLDRLILFEITRLDYKRKIIHVKGKITEECIKLMRESGMINTDDSEFTFSDSNESSKEFDVLINDLKSEEVSEDSGHHSPKKKKSKKLHNISLEDNLSPTSTILNLSLELQNSTDKASNSSSVKKRSKHNLTLPLISNESLKIKANNFTSSPPKKKHKKSKKHTLKCEGIEESLKRSSKKRNSDTADRNLKGVDLPLNIKKETCIDSPKKAKKRKCESSEIDGLPKKKRKEESTSNKDKAHKKMKKKSKKDSKKDKKRKLKTKVLSTKKKLKVYKNKLKKNEEKSKKSKSKKMKSIKQETINVPSSVLMKSEIS